MPTSTSFMENYKLCCSDSKTRLKVKSLVQDKCLQFNADRLDAEDWVPLTKALRNDRTLHTLIIKSEYPGKKWRSSLVDNVKPPIYKQSVTQDLIESVTICMKESKILSTIQLQSLPINYNQIELLVKGVKECRSLQHLAITRTPLNDAGIKLLCDSVRTHTGIKTFNLSGCNMSNEGARQVADLIRAQRLVRFSETWKQSLRYREPNPDMIPGIRRITLNDNPDIKDEGFSSIKHELMDDLWIKAIDMQNCGLTNISGDTSMELLKTNTTILVLDIRQNDMVNRETIRSIKTLLTNRCNNAGSEKPCDDDPENDYNHTYHWLDGTQSSISRSDICSSRKPNSEFSSKTVRNNKKHFNLLKTNSLPKDLLLKRLTVNDTAVSPAEEQIRSELEAQQKQRTELADKLLKEWKRRKSIEKERDKLREELHSYVAELNNSASKNRLKTSKSLNLNDPKKAIDSAKSLSTLSAPDIPLAKKLKKQSKRINQKKNRPKQKKLQNSKSCENHKVKRKTNREATHKADKIIENNAQPTPEIKRKNQNEYQCSIQENLDKIKIKHLQFDNHNTVFSSNDTLEIKSEDDSKQTTRIDYRDLSPTSRSQWILKELMNGNKTRDKNKFTQSINDALFDDKNNKTKNNLGIDFGRNWDLTVTL